MVISGRFKDVIVLSNGENIEPEAIETTLTESPAIEQAMLVGQDERSLGCLLVPSLDFLATKGWLTAVSHIARKREGKIYADPRFHSTGKGRTSLSISDESDAT